MKIKKVEKAFNKMIKEEIGSDGYVIINRVETYPDGNPITITGNYGEHNSDGKSGNWDEKFKLENTDGRSLEFLKGMFYKELEKSF